MVKLTLIVAVTFAAVLFVLSALALHAQAFIGNGLQFSKAQIAFPTVLFPVSAVQGGGISLPLIVAAGAAAVVHHVMFRRFIVGRWIAKEKYERLVGDK